jgi:hypothetical protein
MTPEEQAAADKSWADLLITPVTVAPVNEPLMVSDVEGVSDEEYTATIERLLHEQVGEGWEEVREVAIEALKANPDDETAKTNLLHYKRPKSQLWVLPQANCTEKYPRWSLGKANVMSIKPSNTEEFKVGDIPWHRSPEDKYVLMLDNVVTVFGKLEHAGRYGDATAGRALDKAFGRYTRTSLDNDFVVDECCAEMSSDGDDFGSYEPTQSLTWSAPPVDAVGQIINPIQVETVLPRSEGIPARSYVENDAEHYRPEMLQLLPSDFEDKDLGIKGRTSDGTPQGHVEVFVLSEVLKAMQDFDAAEPESLNGARDARFAKFVQQRFETQPFVAPKAEAMEEYALPEHREDAVTARLREITAKQVRTMRERLSALGIYRSANPLSQD